MIDYSSFQFYTTYYSILFSKIIKLKAEASMKKLNIVILILIIIGLLSPKHTAASKNDKPIVIVAPFENLSGVRSMITYEVATSSNPNNPKRSFRVDRYSEAPRHILEDIVTNLGAVPVERQRLDALLLEIEFGRLSGLIDPVKAIKLGKMLGADTVIMGTIISVQSRKTKFKGYGISTTNEIVTCSIRVRIIDVESTKETFSKIVKGSATFSSSNFGGVSDSDVAFTVIENALNNLKDDKDFRQALLPEKAFSVGKEVPIKFNPIPENCDIEIDGIYQGGSPLTVNLPIGREVRVKISKMGYDAWEATIVPKEGLIVSPELQKKH